MVIYGSRHGNTQRVAKAIAEELRGHGSVDLLAVEDAPGVLAKKAFDLIVVGGPTEAHRMSVPLADFFERIEPGALEGKAAAGFDTRLGWPMWLSGTAAAGIATKLREAGARVIAPEASFVVAGKYPELRSGELERAAAWASALAGKVEDLVPSGTAVKR
jgi:flavodoxin